MKKLQTNAAPHPFCSFPVLSAKMSIQGYSFTCFSLYSSILVYTCLCWAADLSFRSSETSKRCAVLLRVLVLVHILIHLILVFFLMVEFELYGCVLFFKTLNADLPIFLNFAYPIFLFFAFLAPQWQVGAGSVFRSLPLQNLICA